MTFADPWPRGALDQRSISRLATIGQAREADGSPTTQRKADMSADRQDINALVFEYLARGGRVLKLPGAIPATRDEVLRYLKAQKVNVATARRNLVNDPDALIKLANVHRCRQGQPPFQRA